MTGSVERQLGRADSHPTEHSPRDETGVHVELWMRRNVPSCVRDVQETVYERVERLHEACRIASFSHRSWDTVEMTPDKTSTAHGVRCREKIAEFEAWASDHGVSLGAGFRTCTASSMVADDCWTELVPPMLCLSVYEDGELGTVFPHDDGDRVHTVTDGLERLEAKTAVSIGEGVSRA